MTAVVADIPSNVECRSTLWQTLTSTTESMLESPERHIRCLSFVIPAYREAENLELLFPRVLAQARLAERIQVIVVDDHSDDGTLDVVRRWAKEDARIQGVRLSKNSGSHLAILCGLRYAEGDATVVIAADGQDPPEFTPELTKAWSTGAHVVWAVREARLGETLATRVFSRLYYATMNRFASVRLPPSGADFVLLDRRVVDALVSMRERNTQVLALIAWLGFRQQELSYTKEARLTGRSKWTLRRKLRLVADSLVGFSTFPLKLATGAGFLYAGLGFLYALALVVNKLTGGALWGPARIEGWSALMVILLVSTGTILVVLGVMGEYLWRTLDEVRARPRFAIEDHVNLPQLDAGK